MFRVSQHPSSGVSKTVPAASGTGHTTCTATPLQRGLIKEKMARPTPMMMGEDYGLYPVSDYYYHHHLLYAAYLYLYS